MARVQADGPFSAFPEIDRTLTVLEGGVLRLSVGGREPVRLGPASAPFSFAGDEESYGSIDGRAVTDLNVMTRRGRMAHRVTVVGSGPVAMSRPDPVAVLLVCRGELAVVTTAQEPVRLERHDTLLASDGGDRWTVNNAVGDCLFVEIWRC